MNKDTAALFDKICGLDTPELKSLFKAIDNLKADLEYRAWLVEVDKVIARLPRTGYEKELYRDIFDLGFPPTWVALSDQTHGGNFRCPCFS